MAFKEIILFHYHLRKGGVTDVIVLALNAMAQYLTPSLPVTLLCGRMDNLDKVRNRLSTEARNNIHFKVIAELDYMENVPDLPTAEGLYSLLKESYGGEDRLWWVHNYHLGKNTRFTEALLLAADDSQPMLLQIHDFPECARYENLQKLKDEIPRDIYPRGASVRYALINLRDKNLLIDSGIDPSQVFLLDNPVPLSSPKQAPSRAVKDEMVRLWGKEFPGFDPEGALALYPVRTIRRKNVLEAGFLMALMEKKVNLVVTLPGVSQSEQEYSDRVEEVFRKGWIPGMCGIGMREETALANYSLYWAASDLLVSSSIQEGFGYLYVNSLHWKKPLIARYLDIMDGFNHLFEGGFSCFYEEVKTPLTEEQKRKLLKEYRKKLDDLEKYINRDRGEELYAEIQYRLDAGELGFSFYSLDLQVEILKRLHEDKTFRKECKKLNQPLIKQMEQVLDSRVPSLDEKINDQFGEKRYCLNLQEILKSFSHSVKSEEFQGSVQENLIEKFSELPYIRLLY